MSAAEEQLPEREPRHHVMLSAEISASTSDTVTRHRVKDLSPGGARIDGADSLTPGSTVLVTVGALQAVGATVMWVRESMAGLRFVEEIDPSEARSKTMMPAAIKSDHESRLSVGRSGSGPNSGAATAGWSAVIKDPYRR